jgi:hypothetical protein
VLVTNAYNSVTSSVALLDVVLVPTITRAPVNQSVAVGRNTAFTVEASGAAPLAYQWSKDNRPIAGATNATLALTAVADADAGSYAVSVTNSAGSVRSNPVTLVVSAAVSKIINMSVRTVAGTGSETLIVGFVVAGQEGTTKPVLVRGIGPTLTAFGVAGALADPVLELYRGAIRVAANDNWGDSPEVDRIGEASRVSGAFPLAARSLDAALYSGLQGGGYSAQVSGRAGTGTGIALVELYDANSALPARLTNVSARSSVSRGAGVLIAGFVIQGNTPKTVLVRGIGPTLGTFGVTGALVDPQLVLNRGNEVIATNDNWSTGSGAVSLTPIFNAVGAFTLAGGTRDAALVATLQPGNYTVTLSGADDGSGVALIEIYEVP